MTQNKDRKQATRDLADSLGVPYSVAARSSTSRAAQRRRPPARNDAGGSSPRDRQARRQHALVAGRRPVGRPGHLHRPSELRGV
jgi:hypothetical protein